VDHGEGEPGHPQTPILCPTATRLGIVAAAPSSAKRGHPGEVSEFVLAKIREHLIERHRRRRAASACAASAAAGAKPDPRQLRELTPPRR